MERPRVTRRNALRLGGVIAGAAVLDQSIGFIYEAICMSDRPETEVLKNPSSNHAILVVGGEANDGIDVARGMAVDLLPLGSVIGLRYAQTNVKSSYLTAAVERAIEQSGLGNKTLDMYLNSAAGPIMAESLRNLSRSYRLGTVIFDCSPCTGSNVKGFEGYLVRDHANLLDHSRIINLIARYQANRQEPPATDKAVNVSLNDAAADRRAIVHADTITEGMETVPIRNGVRRGLLAGRASFVFMHSYGTDPLVDSKGAYRDWMSVCGLVREVIDPYRPANSHAAGPTWPKGVAMVLAHTL